MPQGNSGLFFSIRTDFSSLPGKYGSMYCPASAQSDCLAHHRKLSGRLPLFLPAAFDFLAANIDIRIAAAHHIHTL